MGTDRGNTRALSLRNIMAIFEKQRMFLSCPDWLAEGARFELADPLRGLQFSRLARSAAPSPLRAEESSDVNGQRSSVREEQWPYRTGT
jgi:hypothetical protein